MKKSLSLNHQTTSFIDLTFPSQYSKAVNTHMNDYQLCLIQSIPDLTEEEWNLFIDMNNQHQLEKNLSLTFQFMRHFKVLNYSELSDEIKTLDEYLGMINVLAIITVIDLESKHPDHSINDVINMLRTCI